MDYRIYPDESYKQLSVVIPCWSGTSQLTMMALDLCKQIRGMCDELIITEDSGEYSNDLQKISDLYLMHPRLGDLLNSRLGIEVAHGEYIAVINSDITILKGNLRELCIPGKIVSPTQNYNQSVNGFVGWFFVGPKILLEDSRYELPKVEALGGWGRPYYNQIKDVFEQSEKLTFIHHFNQSYKEFMLQERQNYHSVMNKEVDPHRHKARLLENSKYAERWGDESNAEKWAGKT